MQFKNDALDKAITELRHGYCGANGDDIRYRRGWDCWFNRIAAT